MATGRLTELRHDLGRENTRGESSPENGRELFVQTANAHLVEVPVRVDDRLYGSFAETCGPHIHVLSPQVYAHGVYKHCNRGCSELAWIKQVKPFAFSPLIPKLRVFTYM